MRYHLTAASPRTGRPSWPAASAGFAEELSRQRLGLNEVAASLPAGSALVAIAQYKKIDLTPRSPSTASDKPAPKAKNVPSYLAFVLRAGESVPLAAVSWRDVPHAARIVAVTAVAIALYQTLGFLLTMALLLFALIFGA